MPIRPAEFADVGPIASALAAAFAADPPLQFLVPGRSRQRLLESYFTAYVPLYLRRGEVWTDGHGAAAAWAPPGTWPFGGADAVRALPTLMRTFGRNPRRAYRAERADLAGRPAVPYWFLDFIGVDPGAQRRGTGSALLEAKTAQLDAEGEPAYLNAGSPRSRDLYLRHGFEVAEEFVLPGGGPPLWRMWRRPRSDR